MVETSLPHTTPPFVTPVKSVAVISNPVPFVVAFAAVASTVSSTTGASVASSENVSAAGASVSTAASVYNGIVI